MRKCLICLVLVLLFPALLLTAQVRLELAFEDALDGVNEDVLTADGESLFRKEATLEGYYSSRAEKEETTEAVVEEDAGEEPAAAVTAVVEEDAGEEPVAAVTAETASAEQKKPARFSYGISSGFLNTRYIVDDDYGIWHHSTAGGYVGLDFQVRLDQKARFFFDLGFLSSFGGYSIKQQDGEKIDIETFSSTNAGFIGFSYNRRAKTDIPAGIMLSLGATLSNTTLEEENLTNLGPTAKINIYAGIPGNRYDYVFTFGGMLTPNLLSDMFDQGVKDIDNISVQYSIGLGFRILPKGGAR